MKRTRMLFLLVALLSAGLLAALGVVVALGGSSGISEAQKQAQRCAELNEQRYFMAAENACTYAIDLDPELGVAYYTRAQANAGQGLSSHARSDAAKACDLGLQEACEFRIGISVEEALDLLPTMVLQVDDLPVGFEPLESTFAAAPQRSEQTGISEWTLEDLERWEFVLSYRGSWAEAVSRSVVSVEISAFESNPSADLAFTNSSIEVHKIIRGDPSSELLNLPILGDNRIGFFQNITGPYFGVHTYQIVVAAGSFVSTMRVALPEREGSRQEAIDLATKLASRMAVGVD